MPEGLLKLSSCIPTSKLSPKGISSLKKAYRKSVDDKANPGPEGRNGNLLSIAQSDIKLLKPKIYLVNSL
jgi:hypothetical protein